MHNALHRQRCPWAKRLASTGPARPYRVPGEESIVHLPTGTTGAMRVGRNLEPIPARQGSANTLSRPYRAPQVAFVAVEDAQPRFPAQQEFWAIRATCAGAQGLVT